MKKFNLCLLILLIFGGFIFYKGWTQFKVDSDKYGILISKTNGVADKPIVPGEFSWYWQFLLPTNTTLKQFTIKPTNTEKTITGELPSGSIYSSIFNSSDNFSYSFTFTIALTLSPESLVTLYKNNVITNDEDLQIYLNSAADSIAQLSANYYLNKAKENQNFNLESIRRNDVVQAIQYYKDYPEIELTTFALTDSKIPDFKLYNKIQNQVLVNTPNTSVSIDIPESTENMEETTNE